MSAKIMDSDADERQRFDDGENHSQVLLWAVLGLTAIPLAYSYLSGLWQIEHYRFFPFAILFTFALTRLRWDGIARGPRGWLSWLSVVASMSLIGIAVVVASPWLSAVGTVLLIGTFLFSNEGERDANLLYLAVPLMLVVRLPLGLDHLLVLQLQRITTTLSSVLLDLVAIPHTVSNNAIELVSRELFVAEACSGVQSVFTLMFVGAVIVTLNRRSMWLAILYFAISILLAVVTNVFRVSTVAFADVRLGLDLASGWQHELVGYLALGIGVLFLLSFDQLMRTLAHPIAEGEMVGSENVLIWVWNKFFGGEIDEDELVEHVPSAAPLAAASGFSQTPWIRTALIGCCAVFTLVATAQAFNMTKPFQLFGSGEIIFTPNPNIFEGKLASLKIVGHESTTQQDNPRLGQNADVWRCEVGEGSEDSVECQFVLSQPYSDWHELCLCYEAGDWQLLNREIRQKGSGDRNSDSYAVARFTRGGRQYGYLVYSGLDAVGNVLPAPPLAGVLGGRFRGMVYRDAEGDVMMLQIFVASEEKIDASVLSQLESDFLTMRESLSSEMTEAK